jgi:molybdopterin molybdotransferase
MAQLTDDSFAFRGNLMPVDDAVAILSARVKPVEEVKTVDLRHADGRILVHDISAPLPLPPFTNSAVDGYVVRSRDLARDAAAVEAAGSLVQWRMAIKPGRPVAMGVIARARAFFRAGRD